MKVSDFLTIQEINDYLTAQSADMTVTPGYDNNVKLFQKNAYTKIASFLGYDFVSQDFTAETARGNGTKRIFLVNRPVTKLTEVRDANDQVISGVQLYNDSLYFPSNTVLGKLYFIDYTAGYSASAMPADIKTAGLLLVALYMNQSAGGSLSVGKSTISSSNGTSDTIDPDAEQKILEKLRGYVSYA